MSPDWQDAHWIGERGLDAKYHGEQWHAPSNWMNPNPYAKKPTFAIVRDPYDRIISEYHHLSKESHDTPQKMQKWIDDNLTRIVQFKHFPGHFLPQHFYIVSPSGKQIINHVIRYETLEEEFPKLMEQYKLSDIVLPPKGKFVAPTFNTQWTNRHLTIELIARINDIYSRDFDELGYKMVTEPSEFQAPAKVST